MAKKKQDPVPRHPPLDVKHIVKALGADHVAPVDSVADALHLYHQRKQIRRQPISGVCEIDIKELEPHQLEGLVRIGPAVAIVPDTLPGGIQIATLHYFGVKGAIHDGYRPSDLEGYVRLTEQECSEMTSHLKIEKNSVIIGAYYYAHPKQ